MAKNNNLTDFLTGVADAIRSKKGTTDLINPQDFESEILSIETGGSTEQQYTVRVYDYDGTILLETTGKDGDIINLPEVPTNEKLAFQEWVSSKSLNEDENSVTINGNDIAVGAVYSSASGNHEFDIRLTKKTGLEVNINVDGVKDWGDGSSDETNTHTYSDYGDYTISVSGSVDFSEFVMNQTSNAPNYTLMNVRLGVDYNVSGNNSFQYCRSLSTITIPRSYNSRSAGYDFNFQYCYSLKHFTTEPGGIKIIKNYKFNSCLNISSIVIPNDVTSIGYYTFQKCNNLTSIVIPNGLTSIENYAFQGCKRLKSITVPDSVTTIEMYAFTECSNLTSVTIGNGVVSIGQYAFQYCYNLTSVTIGNGLISIGMYAFMSCYNLISITILNGLNSIGGSAFNSCKMLKSITIPDSVTSIGDYAFSDCSGLTSVTIGNGVTSIGSQAFQRCISLTGITIPNGVTSIGEKTFSECSGLTSVTIGNGVTSIGSQAFNNCISLRSVTIPETVTNIGERAFSNFYSCLEYNFSNNTQVPTLSNVNAFININLAAKIIVPDSLYDTWITSTNWVDLADYIYKVSEV